MSAGAGEVLPTRRPETEQDPRESADLTLDPDADTLGSGRGPAPSPGLLVGRYEVGRLIGRGGSGQVHEALDHLQGVAVAVKFVPRMHAGHWRLLRRELTALRLLDLPGVVRLFDDGEDGDQAFLVMELLRGGTLDRLAGPWERWAPAARTWLETLARVHFAGVIHRDLKPGNILLDDEERPVLADFGLAQGEGPAERVGLTEGTPRYMPPEQRAGLPCDARTDLYAVGAIFWELAVGHPLPPEPAARAAGIGGAAVPEPVRALVLRLLAAEPEARPRDVEEVLAAIGGDPIEGPLQRIPDLVDEDELQCLIEDTSPSFVHVAEDVASLLMREARGRGEPIRRRLAQWVRAGRAVWVGDRLRVTRSALAAVQWEHSAEVERLVESRAEGDSTLVTTAMELADRARRRGDLRRAIAVLDSVLPALEAEHQRPVVVALTAAALAFGDPTLLRHAAYRAQRAEHAAALQVLRAERLVNGGQVHRALELLDGLQVDPAESDLELWRRSLANGARGRLGDRALQRAALDHERSWAEQEPRRQARWLAWSGHSAYAEGRFAAARDLFELSARLLERDPAERLIAWTHAAAAALECADPDRTLAHAEAARSLGARLRQPRSEARATWLLRAAMYRSNVPLTASEALVDAAAAVQDLLEAQFAITEAAFAWRGGDVELAGTLASRSAVLFARLGFGGGHLLALGLQAATGRAASHEVVAAARASTDGTLALQALALARAPVGDLPVPEWLSRWHLPREARADVLSRAEIEDALR